MRLQRPGRLARLLAALALAVATIGVAPAATAAERIEPQGICDPTGWIQTGTWSGQIDSPLIYAAPYKAIQYRVLGGRSYKRTMTDCTVRHTRGGTAAQYRYRDCYGTCQYTSWKNVSKGCSFEPTKYTGYNYYRTLCNSWSAGVW